MSVINESEFANLKVTKNCRTNPEWLRYPCKQQMDDYIVCKNYCFFLEVGRINWFSWPFHNIKRLSIILPSTARQKLPFFWLWWLLMVTVTSWPIKVVTVLVPFDKIWWYCSKFAFQIKPQVVETVNISVVLSLWYIHSRFIEETLGCSGVGESNLEGLVHCKQLAKIHKECKEKHNIQRNAQIR